MKYGNGARRKTLWKGVAHSRTKTNMLRKLAAALMTLSIVWMGWSVLVPSQEAQSATGAVEVVNYTVRPGDTLWSYARSITPENGNVANMVQELKTLNNLESSSLQPGQNLLVPAR
jgi:LysM repeat protein